MRAMNAERLHALANELKVELEQGSATLVQQLANGLQQAVQEPNQPSHQQSVSASRQKLIDMLEDAPSNRFSPAWRQALEELGVEDLVGRGLRTRIESIFARNEITLSAAAEQLAPIAKEIEGLNQALDQVRAGFGFFGVGAEELNPGDFEIGFLVPRRAVGEELEELGKEFGQIKRILGPLLELSTGGRPDVRVRSISSSEFQVFLESAPATALILATALERLISSYEKVMNIRLARQQLEENGASEETLSSAAGDAEEKMAKDIGELVEQLLTDAEGVESGRANELRKELKESLNALANRIDAGYSIEVRAGELPEPDDEAAGEEDHQAAERRQVVEEVSAKQERLSSPTSRDGRYSNCQRRLTRRTKIRPTTPLGSSVSISRLSRRDRWPPSSVSCYPCRELVVTRQRMCGGPAPP